MSVRVYVCLLSHVFTHTRLRTRARTLIHIHSFVHACLRHGTARAVASMRTIDIGYRQSSQGVYIS